MPILLWLFLIPFLAAAFLFCCSSISAKELKRLAIILSLIPLLLLILNHFLWIGSQVNYNWLPNLSIRFNLKVDSLSLLFLYLTAVIIPVSLAAMSSKEVSHPYFFYGLILLLEGLLFG